MHVADLTDDACIAEVVTTSVHAHAEMCLCTADVVVDVPTEQKVLVKSGNGKECIITLLSGKNALNEQFGLEGLALTMLGIPIYDSYGLSGHIFHGDIMAQTTLKPGEVKRLLYCSICMRIGLALLSIAAHSTKHVYACNNLHITSTNILSACRNEVYQSISCEESLVASQPYVLVSCRSTTG